MFLHPDNLRDLGCKRGSKEAGVGQVKRKGAAELGQVGIFQASEERGAGNETRYFGLPRQTLNPSQLISRKRNPLRNSQTMVNRVIRG